MPRLDRGAHISQTLNSFQALAYLVGDIGELVQIIARDLYCDGGFQGEGRGARDFHPTDFRVGFK